MLGSGEEGEGVKFTLLTPHTVMPVLHMYGIRQGEVWPEEEVDEEVRVGGGE